MEYGLIGEKLGHSYSAQIHGAFGYYDYELKEIPRDGLDGFMKEKAFKGINVTIPYKEKVIPYLDHIDDAAARIGAVNTVVNRDGVLSGYNTDFIGLKNLMEYAGGDYNGSTILILGSGGTSKTAAAVCEALGAACIRRVSRSGREGTLTYEEAAAGYADAGFIVNTTPVGMFPNIDASPVDLTAYGKLKGVIDVIFNPAKTRLMMQAEELGIRADGGLRMLVYQAVAAAKIFTGNIVSDEKAEEIIDMIGRGKK